MYGLKNPTPQLNGLTSLGCSNAIKIPYGTFQHTFESWIEHRAISTGLITAVTLKVQGSLRDDGRLGIVNNPGLAIGSTAEKFANGQFTYRIADINYNLAADAVGAVFSSNHTITASKFGVIKIFIDSSGSFLTLSTQLGQDQTTALAAASAEAALVISDAIPYPANCAFVGDILIENDSSLWTANTDDLTDSVDVTTATFINAVPGFADIYTHSYAAEEMAHQRAMFFVSNTYCTYIRLFLSLLTGTGKVYGQHLFVMPKVRA